MKRDSFVFYRSFFEAIEKLKKNDKLTVYSHLCKYALGEDVGELDGVPGAIFDLIKPQIDANLRRYENGTKGGRPKTETKPNHNLDVTKTEPNVNVNVNENVNDNENVNVSDSDSETQTHTHSSSNRPTNKQIFEAIMKCGYNMTGDSVQRFIDYNNEHGWKLGLEEALKRWNEREQNRKPEKINFLNNAVPRSGSDWEENESNKAKLIAMQQ